MTTNYETSSWRPHALRSNIYFMSGVMCVLVCVVIVAASMMTSIRLLQQWALPDQRKEAQREVGNIDKMAQQYMLQSSPSKAPDTLEDLTDCEPPITERIPQDPWGNDYIYRRNSDVQWLVFSAGPDGIPRSSDDIHPY